MKRTGDVTVQSFKKVNDLEYKVVIEATAVGESNFMFSKFHANSFNCEIQIKS